MLVKNCYCLFVCRITDWGHDGWQQEAGYRGPQDPRPARHLHQRVGGGGVGGGQGAEEGGEGEEEEVSVGQSGRQQQQLFLLGGGASGDQHYSTEAEVQVSLHKYFICEASHFNAHDCSVVPQLPSMINIANSDNNAQEIYLAQMGIRECTNRVSFDASIKS